MQKSIFQFWLEDGLSYVYTPCSQKKISRTFFL